MKHVSDPPPVRRQVRQQPPPIAAATATAAATAIAVAIGGGVDGVGTGEVLQELHVDVALAEVAVRAGYLFCFFSFLGVGEWVWVSGCGWVSGRGSFFRVDAGVAVGEWVGGCGRGGEMSRVDGSRKRYLLVPAFSGVVGLSFPRDQTRWPSSSLCRI